MPTSLTYNRYYPKLNRVLDVNELPDEVPQLIKDVFIAKNYLTEEEIDTLNRLVVIFLETAELRAKNRIDISMDFWRKNVDGILEFNDKTVLQGSGTIAKAAMEEKVRAIYADFDAKRKTFEAQLADEQDLDDLKKLEAKIKRGQSS